MKVPEYAWVALGVLLLVTLVAALARAATAPPKKLTGRALDVARQLIQSACRSARAAEQDLKYVQKLTDAQFGLAYVNSARLLARSDDVLEAVTDTKIDELFATLRAHQRVALDAIAKRCPSIGLDTSAPQ